MEFSLPSICSNQSHFDTSLRQNSFNWFIPYAAFYLIWIWLGFVATSVDALFIRQTLVLTTNQWHISLKMSATETFILKRCHFHCTIIKTEQILDKRSVLDRWRADIPFCVIADKLNHIDLVLLNSMQQVSLEVWLNIDQMILDLRGL